MSVANDQQLAVLPKQFLVTQCEIDPPQGWRRHEFAGNYLYRSPDVPVTRIESTARDTAPGSIDLVLGWFVFEGAVYPNDRADRICTDLTLERLYHCLTGRFLILSGKAGQFRCISDPGGLLSVVYRPGNCEIAATPRSLELTAPITPDEQIRQGLVRQDGTTWYAFGTTPFAGINRLLPGTVLDMPSAQTRPVSDHVKLVPQTQDAVNHIFNHTQEFIAALGRQNALECHVTAGWDSRMVVSASINTPADISYLTYKTPGSNGSVDCQVSRLIARTLSLKHTEVPLRPSSQKNVDAWLWRTADCIEDSVMHLAPTVAATYSGRYVLCGMAGEVGRAFYWRRQDVGRSGLTAGELLDRLGFSRTGVALELSEQWLEPHKASPTPLILDQAYIDLRLGGWGGPSVYGHPVSIPTLTPFNNAVIYSLMKSLPQNYRLSGQFARDFVALGSEDLARLPVNRARGLQRLWNVKKEIAGILPSGTKRALRLLLAR